MLTILDSLSPLNKITVKVFTLAMMTTQSSQLPAAAASSRHVTALNGLNMVAPYAAAEDSLPPPFPFKAPPVRAKASASKTADSLLVFRWVSNNFKELLIYSFIVDEKKHLILINSLARVLQLLSKSDSQKTILELLTELNQAESKAYSIESLHNILDAYPEIFGQSSAHVFLNPVQTVLMSRLLSLASNVEVEENDR